MIKIQALKGKVQRGTFDGVFDNKRKTERRVTI